ncbi:hypothetical protein PLICRDRAFT_676647 [Plicaturopsis crispa FD-325 SS-3]|uniref:Uncharacterized protein n=1 Tax=Plicaturopsis crispa FD-325 SS-3 TaxID=944288 RepID=A0A0C9SQC6_PLICR|nr:hypothetical protein PLICRDRAFT_676647 [Plicaturopsis crispa FD-325 SS-3]
MMVRGEVAAKVGRVGRQIEHGVVVGFCVLSCRASRHPMPSLSQLPRRQRQWTRARKLGAHGRRGPQGGTAVFSQKTALFSVKSGGSAYQGSRVSRHVQRLTAECVEASLTRLQTSRSKRGADQATTTRRKVELAGRGREHWLAISQWCNIYSVETREESVVPV